MAEDFFTWLQNNVMPALTLPSGAEIGQQIAAPEKFGNNIPALAGGAVLDVTGIFPSTDHYGNAWSAWSDKISCADGHTPKPSAAALKAWHDQVGPAMLHDSVPDGNVALNGVSKLQKICTGQLR